MTPTRQERKSRRFRAVLAVFLGTLLLGDRTSPSIGAATAEWVVVNRYTGLAIDGFDPVAYFVDAMPKQGRAELELRSAGAVWRFSNQGNRSAFAGAPDIYAPRFGGHDPMAVARATATPGHPELWLIAEQRLYLFYSDEARTAFASDMETAIDAAERNWPALQRTLVRN
jgi:hypothetical protein